MTVIFLFGSPNAGKTTLLKSLNGDNSSTTHTQGASRPHKINLVNAEQPQIATFQDFGGDLASTNRVNEKVNEWLRGGCLSVGLLVFDLTAKLEPQLNYFNGEVAQSINRMMNLIVVLNKADLAHGAAAQFSPQDVEAGLALPAEKHRGCLYFSATKQPLSEEIIERFQSIVSRDKALSDAEKGGNFPALMQLLLQCAENTEWLFDDDSQPAVLALRHCLLNSECRMRFKDFKRAMADSAVLSRLRSSPAVDARQLLTMLSERVIVKPPCCCSVFFGPSQSETTQELATNCLAVLDTPTINAIGQSDRLRSLDAELKKPHSLIAEILSVSVKQGELVRNNLRLLLSTDAEEEGFEGPLLVSGSRRGSVGSAWGSASIQGGY